MSAPIRYSSESYDANLIVSGRPEDNLRLVRELGASGPAFVRELESHRNKAPSKARRDLDVFEQRLLTGERYSEFTPFQLRVAVEMTQAAKVAVPTKRPGPRQGQSGGLAFRALQKAVLEVRPTLEAAGEMVLRKNADEIATALADNPDWLKTQNRLATMPRDQRIEEIASSVRASARRLSQEYWGSAMSAGQGRRGEVGTAVRLLKMAEGDLSPEARKVLFDDPEKPEYEDGRDIPLDAAAKSIAVQFSKKRSRRVRSAE